MILDSILSIEKYYVLPPRFKEALNLITSNTKKMEPGRYDVDGDDLYVVIASDTLKKEEEAYLEAHDRYIDIQVVLEGYERYGWKTRSACGDIKTSYDKEKDLVFYYDKPTTYFELRADEFAVFFPEDAHAPMIGEGVITKAVIKVKTA